MRKSVVLLLSLVLTSCGGPAGNTTLSGYTEHLHSAARRVCIGERAYDAAKGDAERAAALEPLLEAEMEYERMLDEYRSVLRTTYGGTQADSLPSLEESKQAACGKQGG